MALLCKHCQAPVPIGNLNPSGGVGFCPQCNQGFSLAEVAGPDGVLPLDLPANSKIRAEQTEGSLIVHMPQGMPKAMAVFMVIFGACFELVWCAGLILFMLNMDPKSTPGLVYLMPVFMLIVGSLMCTVVIGTGVYLLKVTYRLVVDVEQMTFERRFGQKVFRKQWPLADLTRIQVARRGETNGKPMYAVTCEFNNAKQPLSLGYGLSEEELAWLSATLQFFVYRTMQN